MLGLILAGEQLEEHQRLDALAVVQQAIGAFACSLQHPGLSFSPIHQSVGFFVVGEFLLDLIPFE